MFQRNQRRYHVKIEASTCNITRDRTARIIRFALSKAVSVEVGVGVFESTGIYPFNRKIVLQYLFSISDISETKILWKQHLQICLWFVYPLRK
jgi:hypothetical protein